MNENFYIFLINQNLLKMVRLDLKFTLSGIDWLGTFVGSF